ncbi:uncharacterized protein CBL_12516 [Carabus blaptoides fortunei]
MDTETLKSSISQYKEQLKQINVALAVTDIGPDKDDLINLKSDIEQLIELTEENLNTITSQVDQPSTSQNNAIDDEYLMFMKEMEKEGAIDTGKDVENTDVEDDLKSLEGMKCQAPHTHSWGDIVYHNAMVCGIVSTEETQSFNDIQVKVMYTNPTHQEMLPCPYFLEGSCKFSDEKCRFSHGESVQLSNLQEFKEPDFESLKNGDKILAKRKDKLWHRAILKKNLDGDCTIKFESNPEESIVPLQDILPLDNTDDSSDSNDDNGSDNDETDNEWLIQKSMLNTPPSQMLGDWEKYTKGIGSKLMQQMGYVTGTGLGRYAEGRIEPVQAVVLPAGKSLDHCMTLRENAGGDENLFSVERRLKKIQKRQEIQNKKAYEREKHKKNVFEFLNHKLVLVKDKETITEKCKNKHKQDLKTGTTRDLNVAGLKIEEDIRKIEQDMFKIQESLQRHNNPDTAMNKSLKAKLADKQAELKRLRDYSVNVKNEQTLRKDKKKMTVF